jgi:heptaprenyl diphosphate synthase
MISYWHDFPGMPEALEKVSGIIQTAAVSQNALISEGVSALLQGGGKFLRPGLLLIASEFGKPEEKRWTLAACLEMLHLATLVHDDIIDDAPYRRGVPTLHTRFGARNAVLIGDYLLSQSFFLAAEHTSPQQALRLSRIVSLICTMEIQQDNDRFATDTSLRRYLRKIMGKSALLFSLACHLGAAESNAGPAIVERLRRTGYNIGMAFQIIDDILDYAGDRAEVRKPLGRDIKAGIVTLPLICALPLDTSGTLQKLFAGKRFSGADSETIIAIVRKSGGIEAARTYAETYTLRALREIDALPKGQPRDMLHRLTQRLLVRSA